MIKAFLGKLVSPFRHEKHALAHRPDCFSTFFNIDVFPEPNGPWTKATVLGASNKYVISCFSASFRSFQKASSSVARAGVLGPAAWSGTAVESGQSHVMRLRMLRLTQWNVLVSVGGYQPSDHRTERHVPRQSSQSITFTCTKNTRTGSKTCREVEAWFE